MDNNTGNNLLLLRYCKSRVIDRLRSFGKKPLCNLRAERAPKLGNFVFPLCYRCTGLVVGGIVLFSFSITTDSLLSLLLFIPLPLDYSLQYFTSYESNNFKRFFSGVLFSLGLGLFN